MPGFSKRTDKLLTFVVRFVCGAFIGLGIWAYWNYTDILKASAHGTWKGLLFSLFLWSGIIGLIFGLTSAKDDRQWLE